LAGAHLMVLLQWIVLIQDKQPQQYWWIFALSILQVAISALLTHSPMLGVLLMIYLLTAMWSLSVYSLYLGVVQFEETELTDKTLEFAPTFAFAGGAPLAGEIPLMPLESNAQSVVRGAIQNPDGKNWINLRFVGGVVGM